MDETRTAPAAPHRDDRGGQLDARPRGGARARRAQGRGCARRRRVLRLPLRRAQRRARAARDPRDARRGDDEASAAAARPGHHRRRSRRAPAGDAPARTRTSIRASRPSRTCPRTISVDPRRADPRAGQARRRAQRAHARAARVHARRDRAPARDRGAGGAVDRARAAVRGGAAARRRAGGARADLRGRLGVALPRGVARRDRARRRWTRSPQPGPRSCSRTARSRGRRAARARTRCACRCAGADARSASSSATATRRSPTTTGSCSTSIAHHAAVALEHGRAVMRGVLAQEIHHRVKNNLQTVASLLRLQARATDGVDPRKALEHSVNRILAIAAVHEVLTERRDDDVDARRPARPAPRDARSGGRRRQASVEAALEPVALAGRTRHGAGARLQRAARRTRSSTAART